MEEVRGITKAKIEREGIKKMWYLINRLIKDPHRPVPHMVQRGVDGMIEESTTRRETESFLF